MLQLVPGSERLLRVARSSQRTERSWSLEQRIIGALEIRYRIDKNVLWLLDRLFHAVLEESGETATQLIAKRRARKASVGLRVIQQ